MDDPRLQLISQTLSEERERQGMGFREMARRMGTSNSQLQRVLSGGNMTLETLIRALDVLGITITLPPREF